MEYSISLIIPHYKQPGYLSETLAALAKASQAARSLGDVDLIVLDDSADPAMAEQVRAVVAHHAAGFRTATVHINPQNLGIARSRNRGASFAHGTHLHFVDQDDLVNESFYVHVFQRLCTGLYPDTVLLSNAEIYQGDAQRQPLYRSLMLSLLGRASSMHQLGQFLVGSYIASVGQVVMPVNVFRKAGCYPEPAVQGCDDWGLWVKFSAFRTPLCFLPDARFAYRLHVSNTRNSVPMAKSKQMTAHLVAGELRGPLDVRTNLALWSNLHALQPLLLVYKLTSSLFFNKAK